MLDFLMNPTLNLTVASTTSWLTPWLIMLLVIFKIIMIAIGSLLISVMLAIFGVVCFRLWAFSKQKYLAQKQSWLKNCPPNSSHQVPQFDSNGRLPKIAA